MGETATDEGDVRREQQRDRLLDRRCADRRRLARRWATSVQDEDVDPTEGADGRLDEPLEMLGNREVTLYRERADTVGLPLQQLAPAAEHHDVRALRGKRLRGREAHSGRRAADDRRPSFEPHVHRGEGYPGGCKGRMKRRGSGRQAAVVSTPTTSRTADADSRSIVFSAAVSFSFTISSTPPETSRTGTPM